VDEPHPHPVDHQRRRALGHLAEEGGQPFLEAQRPVGGQVGEVAVDGDLDQPAQETEVSPGGGQLERAEAGEGGRHPTHDRPGLGPGVAVVEHVADHLVARDDQRQGPGGGDAQVGHRLAAEVLPQRRPQHRPAVGTAGVGRGPRPLQLQRLVPTVAVEHLAQRDGPAVAQLAGPTAELVPAVAGGEGVGTHRHPVATEDRREVR
jgi:hypothetical protein